MSPIIVSVEGGIGCGKSTALALIPGALARVVPEPVEAWLPLLQRFYHDNARWAFTLQAHVLASFAALDMSGPGHLIITERSPYSGLAIFAMLLLNSGALDQIELQLLIMLARLMRVWAPDAAVYVYTPAEVCATRIRQRGRVEERDIPLSYLTQLEHQHTAAMTYMSRSNPVFIVDGTQPADVVADIVSAVSHHVATIKRQGGLIVPGLYRAWSL